MFKSKALRLPLAAAAFAAAIVGSVVAKTTPITIEAMSNRADLVSGGDVLLRVTLPDGQAGSGASLSVGGVAVPGALKPASDGKGQMALVTGLPNGKSVVSVTSGGKTAKLEVTNHPSGGPLFSGPQIQPWTCLAGATGPQCDRPSTYKWSYMPTTGNAFKDYNPAAPATDVARVTTSTGASVPFIVRIESFNQNRSGVSVATLFDASKPWTPFAPQAQWNKGVLVLQGSGCGTGYGEQPAGSPLNDRALRQGFAVVTVALLHNTINCNPIVQAEASLMAKEHVIETYGPINMYFGMGGSGGAISQIMDQNAYPGLYDGLILNHLFSDSDASRRAAYDCRLIYDAITKAGGWTEAQRVAVAGMTSGCNASPTRFEIYAPSIGTNCTIPAAEKFNAVTNPKGVRCTLQDYEVNEVGRRPDGFANSRLDTEGVQYGLNALKAGTISPEQFVTLNANIAGHDINFAPIATRTVADRAGLKNLYRSGLNNGENNLADTPIIETRLNVTDFHQPFHAVIVRARLDRAQGHHDNYALWRTTSAREAAFDASFDVMVQWIRAINADARDVPRARKVIDNKPALARDRCLTGDGVDKPLTACPRPVELARVLAGAPDTNDSGKCRLKALNRKDYGAVTFTDEQWTRLQGRFKTGVCDYSKPMVDFGLTVPWLVYSGDGKARPIGPAPRSTGG